MTTLLLPSLVRMRGLTRSSFKVKVESVLSNRRYFSKIDLTTPLPTNENNEELSIIRHSAAHVMAMAVQRLHPDAKITVGPVIDHGFYYDFHFPDHPLSDSDLTIIKK